MDFFRGPAKNGRNLEFVDHVDLSKINGGWDDGEFRIQVDLTKDPGARHQTAGVVFITKEDVLWLCQSLMKETIKDSFKLKIARSLSENENMSPEEKLANIKKLFD